MSSFRSEKIAFEVLRILLRPLARYCIRRHHQYNDFAEAAKAAFVDAAEEEVLATSERVNVSRLSVITGLYRQELTRLFKNRDKLEFKSADLITMLVGSWRNDLRFRTRSGRPRVLTADTDDSEFAELVRSVTKDVSPGTILFELERARYVERTKKGVRLIKEARGHLGDPRQGFAVLSESMDALINAAEENLLDPGQVTNLHLHTAFDNVTPQALDEIRTWLNERGRAVHREGSEYLSKFDKDINPGVEQGGARVVFAVSPSPTLELKAARIKSKLLDFCDMSCSQ